MKNLIKRRNQKKFKQKLMNGKMEEEQALMVEDEDEPEEEESDEDEEFDD